MYSMKPSCDFASVPASRWRQSMGATCRPAFRSRSPRRKNSSWMASDQRSCCAHGFIVWLRSATLMAAVRRSPLTALALGWLRRLDFAGDSPLSRSGLRSRVRAGSDPRRRIIVEEPERSPLINDPEACASALSTEMKSKCCLRSVMRTSFVTSLRNSTKLSRDHLQAKLCCMRSENADARWWLSSGDSSW